MTRTLPSLAIIALTALLAPAAVAQDVPAPVVVPAPTPDPVTPIRKTGCGGDRSVMS